MIMKFHVVTVATHAQSYFPVLKESCIRNGIELEVLGWGTKWGGFATKFKLMREYVATLPEDDIVLFCDGYDVLMLEHKDEVLRKYYSFTKPVVVSCERGTSKLADWTATKVFGPKCEGARINSGCYVGPAKYLVKMFEVMCAQFDCEIGHQDDQQMLTSICHDTDFFVRYVDIDLEQRIFLTATRPHNPYDTTIPIDSEVFRVDPLKKKIVINYTDQSPSFIHANGGGDLVPFMKLYDLPLIHLESKTTKTMSVIKHYHHYFVKEIVALSIIFALIMILSWLSYKNRLNMIRREHSLDANGLCQGTKCRVYREQLESQVRSMSMTIPASGEG